MRRPATRRSTGRSPPPPARQSKAKPRYYRDAVLDEAVRWQRTRTGDARRCWAERYRDGYNRARRFLHASRIKRIQEYQVRKQEHRRREHDRVERERLLEQQAQAAREQEALQRQVAEASRREALASRDQARSARKGRRNMGIVAVLMVLLAIFSVVQWSDAQKKEASARAAELAAVKSEVQTQQALDEVNRERQRADRALLNAQRNLAHARAKAAEVLAERDGAGAHHKALLQGLEAQTQGTRGQFRLPLEVANRLSDLDASQVFANRWRSPSARVHQGPVLSVVIDPTGAWLASAGVVHQ